MLFTLGALLFIGFLLATTISYLISRDAIRATILREELPLSSDNIYSEIQRDLFEPILISSLMANDTFVKDWILAGEDDPLLIQRYLAQIQQRYRTITSFLVSEATRKYYHSESVLKTVDETNPADAWFFRVRKMNTEYEINVDPDMANKETMTIFINYRIVNSQGQFLGTTGVGLTVNAVKALMQDYREKFQRDIYFYNRNGELILHSEQIEADEIKNRLHTGNDKALQEIISRVDAGETNVTFSTGAQGGTMANYRFIPELNWILVVEQKSDGTQSILFRSIAFNLVICLITAAILLTIIRMTVLLYQKKLETRNQQLHETNLRVAQQASELEKANRKLDILHKEKDEFIGITVHDLKNPLNSVIGFSELLIEHPSIPSDSREHASFIQTSASNMLEQVEDLLRLTELESSNHIEQSLIDAGVVMRRAIDDYRFHAKAKSIPLHVTLPEHAVTVRAHEGWLVSAVGNLISNSIKYSPPGKPVSISLHATTNAIEIVITDEGEGIASEEIPRLFQKFERLTPRPTAGESSSGLGLYIVEQMILRMGGRVRCESTLGSGSTFTITLPYTTHTSA